MSLDDKLYLAQVSESGTQIKHLCLLTNDDMPAQNAADTEFIVRACNAHDDLVKALQVAANAIKTRLMYETSGSAEHQEQSWVLETILNTLSNANGQAA